MLRPINYFEYKDRSCQCGFEVVEDWSIMEINPPYILVENELYPDGTTFIINTHNYDEVPEKDQKYWFTAFPIQSVGYWIIKYK